MAIEDAYHTMGEPAVVVRSSATAEDLAEASFAGQQDTYLNVQGVADVLGHVQRCWASLWTARAIHYRQRLGIDPLNVAMGVVVQTLVPAEVAGVLFTQNPTTGAPDELVVNASYGLGESVVSGLVTPDSYVVDRATLQTKQVDVGAKEIMVVAAEGSGTASLAVREDQRRARALPEHLLRELATLGLRAEAHFGSPQDLEWAFADGRLWILQARPVTTVAPTPAPEVRWESPIPGAAWVRRQVAENLPEPLSPLFDELYVRQGLERSLDTVMALFTRAMHGFRLEDFADRPFFTSVNGYAYQRGNYRWGWKTLWWMFRGEVAAMRVLFKEAIPYWRDRALPAYQGTIGRWRGVDPAGLPDQRLLAGVRELAWADAEYWFGCALVVATAKITDGLLDRFLAIAAPGRGLTSGLFLRGFPSRTLDAEAALEELAERIRGSEDLRALVASTPAAGLLEALGTIGPVGRDLLAHFDRYMGTYGHQVYNLDFVAPTQADDPLPVLVSLKAMAQRPGRDVRAHQRELVRERDARAAQTERSFDSLRRRLFRRLLGWAQRHGPYREQALFFLGAGWPTLRRLALELGRRLVRSGSLAAPDDIFFLETVELEKAIAARLSGQSRPELVRLARERRELREGRRRLHPPAAVPPSYRLRLGLIQLSGFETQRRNVRSSATLRGFAVSPGWVRAPASVILSPADFAKMEPGTVLVCPTITPAWTPLFSQACGLVTDIGGILAHGSIIAREYGIPAVMGTGDASARIRQGQRVTVDGDRGLVLLEG